MTVVDLIALAPFLVLMAATVVVMLVVAFARNHALTLVLTLLSLGLAFAALFLVHRAPSRQVTTLLIVDNYALFFIGLLLAASFAVALIAYGYFQGQEGQPEEFYLLLLLATLGSATLAASSHFASFFLGLEILSVSLYAMIAYRRSLVVDVEAGLKYLVLAGASSAFLLFGMALIYAELGFMDFARLAAASHGAGSGVGVLYLAGSAMLLVGFGFKLAVVPFHTWTPDVYQGAPAPSTAFVATVSKAAVFALLLRYFTALDIHASRSLFFAVALIALASMLVGNLLALLQSNVKRILAYSSIAHLGYLLVAFLAAGSFGVTAAAFYVVAYTVTTLGAFGVVAMLSRGDRDAEAMEDYRGLFWRRPWLATVLTAALLSLAGIPLTVGFVGKFYLAAAGVESALWLLVATLVVGSALGAYYYLRVVVAMYSFAAPPASTTPAMSSAALPGRLALALLALLLVALGVYPGPLIQLIEATVGSLS